MTSQCITQYEYTEIASTTELATTTESCINTGLLATEHLFYGIVIIGVAWIILKWLK